MRFERTVESRADAARVFAYISDFSTTKEWDPGISEAEKITPGPVGIGTRFRLRARFMGRSIDLLYEVTAFEPGRSIELRTENRWAAGIDTIRVEPTATGSRVSYRALFEWKGLARLAEPLLYPFIARTADHGIAGLRNKLVQMTRAA